MQRCGAEQGPLIKLTILLGLVACSSGNYRTRLDRRRPMLAFNVTICRRLVCGAFFLSVSAHVSANASDPAKATVDIQLIKETPPEGGIAYRYEKGDCSI